MLTENDIHYRTGVSERPRFVVFRRISDIETGEIFWTALTTAADAQEALFKANLKPMYPDPAHDRFILGTTFAEADNLIHSGQYFTDAEVAIYRSPYPSLAAE